MREIGAPWFAFSSYVLPGWTWIGVPIQLDRSVEAHVRWMEIRIEDFRHELMRLGELFTFEKVGLEPETFVKRVLKAELPRVVAAHDNSGEAYDAVQLACNLMIDAARLPIEEGSRTAIDDFFGASLPTDQELQSFIDELATSLTRDFFHRYGLPPHAGFEREMIALERRTEQLCWEIDWLREQIGRRAFIDDEHLADLRGELEIIEGIARSNFERLHALYPETIGVLEAELDDLESAWIGANDRDSITTEARLDGKITAQVTRLAAHKARLEELEALELATFPP
jgi:hypothetical protein